MTVQLEIGLDRQRHSAARYPWLMEQLVELMRELAAKAGANGVTISDLRIVAGQRGIWLPSPAHYLGAIPRRAGLVKTGRSRSSDVATSHGTAHPVWVAPKYGV